MSYRQIISSHLYVHLNFKRNLFTRWLSTFKHRWINQMLIIWYFSTSIAGRTKCPRGSHAAREPHVWGLVYTMCKTAWVKKKHCWQQSTFLQPILPLKCATAQTVGAVKSHLAHLRHSKTQKKQENKKLFELNVYFVRIFIRFCMFILIVHKACNSFRTLLAQSQNIHAH